MEEAVRTMADVDHRIGRVGKGDLQTAANGSFRAKAEIGFYRIDGGFLDQQCSSLRKLSSTHDASGVPMFDVKLIVLESREP